MQALPFQYHLKILVNALFALVCVFIEANCLPFSAAFIFPSR